MFLRFVPRPIAVLDFAAMRAATPRWITTLCLALALLAGCSKKSSRVVAPELPPASSPFGAFTSAGGPPADTVFALAGRAAPLWLLAATSRGIQRTPIQPNAGWTRVDGRVAHALITVSDLLAYAGTDQGVLRSLDGGVSWDLFNVGLSPAADVRALEYHAGIGLLAGLAGGGVALFPDAGDHWVDASTGLPAGATVTAIAWVFPEAAFFAVANGSIWKSADELAWTSASTGLPANAVLSLLGSYLAAGTDGAGVYLSSDHGASWQPSSTGMAAGARVTRLVSLGVGEVAATDRGLYFTADDAASWQLAITDVYPSTMAYTAAVGLNSSWFVGTPGRGILRTDDLGADWSTFGPPDSKVTAMLEGPFDGVTAVEGQGVDFSPGLAAHWMLSDLTTGTITTFALSNTTVLAGGADGVMRSSNGGPTWLPANSGLPASPSILALASDGTAVVASVAGSTAGVYRSTDAGGTWTPTSGLPPSASVQSLGASPTRMLAGLAAPGGGPSVFESTDHGATWTAAATGLPAGLTVHAVAIDGDAIAHVGTNAGVYAGRGSAISWQPTSLGAGHDVTSLAMRSAGNGVAVVDGSVFRSIDGGATWAKDPGVTAPATCVTAGASNFYAGTVAGTWRAPYAATSPAAPMAGGRRAKSILAPR